MISVVIPAFDAARHLGDAIQSVLMQASRPLEVLVVDDGSSDETAEVARSFGPPVVCWSRAQGGAASARNAGIGRASGELIAFLDADDLWAAHKLARQRAVLDLDADLEAVFGHVQQFSEPTARQGASGPGQALPGYAPGTMLIRAEALRRIGPFDATLPRADVVEWFVRAQAQNLRHVMLPDVLLYRRLHGRNLGVRERDAQRAEYLKVLRAALRDKRR